MIQIIDVYAPHPSPHPIIKLGSKDSVVLQSYMYTAANVESFLDCFFSPNAH